MFEEVSNDTFQRILDAHYANIIPVGHWHNCYSTDRRFLHQDIKCKEPFNILCDTCKKDLENIKDTNNGTT